MQKKNLTEEMLIEIGDTIPKTPIRLRSEKYGF